MIPDTRRMGMYSKPAALILVLLPCFTSAGGSERGPAIWAGAKGGAHGVGVTRVTVSGVDVTYWYPAALGGRVARLGDFATPPQALVDGLVGAGLPAVAARAYVEATLMARWAAPADGGKFPLVLLGQGNQQDAIDQAVLAEIVASHGFVVASIPSPTLKSPMKSEDDVGPLAQRQAESMLATAGHLATMGVADASRVGVIGHSFGARAALLLAMHHARVTALVSLDGGIGTATAQESFSQAPWFSRERGTTSILHVYESAESFMVPDFTMLQSLPAFKLTLRELKGLRHVHFTTIGFQAAIEPAMGKVTRMEASGPASIVAMVDEVVRFLLSEMK